MAWSCGNGDGILKSPGGGFELEVPNQGRDIPALIGRCSGSAEIVDEKQRVMHTVMRCLARPVAIFEPSLVARFAVGDLESMKWISTCNSLHKEAEYSADLKSAFSVWTRENGRSEWTPKNSELVRLTGGVFVLVLKLDHSCDFALGQNVDVRVGGFKLLRVPNLKHEKRIRTSNSSI